jgi:hypothetical protein
VIYLYLDRFGYWIQGGRRERPREIGRAAAE